MVASKTPYLLVPNNPKYPKPVDGARYPCGQRLLFPLCFITSLVSVVMMDIISMVAEASKRASCWLLVTHHLMLPRVAGPRHTG
jgi:hypothetical protein